MRRPVVVSLRTSQAPYHEPSGTVAHDAIASDLVRSCTACGGSSGRVWAQVVVVQDAQRAVQLCHRCHGAPDSRGFRAAVQRLMDRYAAVQSTREERRR